MGTFSAVFFVDKLMEGLVVFFIAKSMERLVQSSSLIGRWERLVVFFIDK